MKKLSTLAAVFLATAMPLRALAQTQPRPPSPPSPSQYYWPGPGHMMWGSGDWGGPYGGSFWEMIPMFVLLTVLVCTAIFYFARGTFAAGHHSWSPSPPVWDDPSRSALQILNERFAKGEIQKTEYEEKKVAILAGTKR